APPYQNTSGVLVTGCDTNVLIQLLNNAIALGDTAGQLKEALGSNGHKADKLAEVKQYLEQQANK
ncbi:unnamed protein product, partial [marine sediment metagenome]